MPVRRTLVALLAAILVAGVVVPAAAAQTMPAPESLPPVTELPQVEDPPDQPAEDPPDEPAEEPPASEQEGEDEPTGASGDEARAGELPNTGSDARIVALLGAMVLLCGVGLRLRTAPEHF